MTVSPYSSGSPLAFAILGVSHIQAALDFYRDVIGLDASPPVTWSGPAFEKHFGLPVGSSATAVMFGITAAPGLGPDVGRVLALEFHAQNRVTIPQKGDRTYRGLWNLNFYVDDIRATTKTLQAKGYDFWSEPTGHEVSVKAGAPVEVLFDGPDGLAINLVELTGDDTSTIGRLKKEVDALGKTKQGFTQVSTTSHSVVQRDKALLFYTRVLGMHVQIDDVLSSSEANLFLCRPHNAKTRATFVAGRHQFGKVALSHPENYAVPNKIHLAVPPNIGYLAQSFCVPSILRAVDDCKAVGAEMYSPPMEIEIPTVGLVAAMIVRNPGSGALMHLYENSVVNYRHRGDSLMAATMRVMQAAAPGGPSVLQPQNIPVPVPGPGQALIKVAYVGMNPIDAMARAGKIDFLPITWPFTPGLEKTGIVERMGAGVDEKLVGQRVIAREGFGGYGDYALTIAKTLLTLDPRISLKTGAVYRGASFTAWHALYKAGRLQKGETVLVHSAAGAIGIMAVQIAKDAGCTVVGLCGGPTKVAYATSFGADHVFDYTQSQWVDQVKAATNNKGCDVILDGNGGPNAEHNISLTAALGRIVYIGATAGPYPAPVAVPTLIFKNISVVGMNLAPIEDPPGSATDRAIIEAVASGRWRVPLSETVDLANIADLHARLEARTVMGRAVIQVGGDLDQPTP